MSGNFNLIIFYNQMIINITYSKNKTETKKTRITLSYPSLFVLFVSVGNPHSREIVETDYFD
jgi:hypothetical protein